MERGTYNGNLNISSQTLLNNKCDKDGIAYLLVKFVLVCFAVCVLADYS